MFFSQVFLKVYRLIVGELSERRSINMFKFNYDSFKSALKASEQEAHAVLMDDLERVKAFVEKGLTLFLESSANISCARYPGIEI